MVGHHAPDHHHAIHPAHDARWFLVALIVALALFMLGAGVAVAPGITG